MRQGADAEIRVERDRAGEVVEVSQAHRSVRFGRDEVGRIVDVAFAAGGSARYFYNELGNRTLTQHGDGRSVAYEYDAAGSMTAIEEGRRDGTMRRWIAAEPTGPTGSVGRLPALDAGHDAVSKMPASDSSAVETRVPTVTVERAMPGTGAGEPADVHSSGSVATVLAERVGGLDAGGSAPPGLRSPHERLAALMGDGAPNGQPDHGVLVFNRGLQAADRDPVAADVPSQWNAWTLLEVARPLFANTAADELDRIGDPLLLSPELRPDEFLRGSMQDTSGTACPEEPQCDPGEAPVYASIEAGPVLEAETTRRVWGGAFLDYDDSSLECREVCPDAVYRILGEVKAIDNYGFFRPDIMAVGSCAAGERTDDNKMRTELHEKHHLTKGVSAIVDGRQHARRDFRDMDSCETGLKVFKGALARTFADEWDSKQGCHRDEHFLTQFVYAAKCMSPDEDPPAPSVEVRTDRTMYGICSEAP